MESDLLKEMNDAANNELMRETYERRISAIEAERERLRAALKPFAEFLEDVQPDAYDKCQLELFVWVHDIRTAAEALKEDSNAPKD